MNAKTRVKMAVALQEPDRVPMDFWADKRVTRNLLLALGLDQLEQLLQELQIDFRFIEGSVYCGPALNSPDQDTWLDIWGVRRKRVLVDPEQPERGSYEHVVDHPLAGAETVQDIDKYSGWPSPDWYDYSQVARLAARHAEFAVVCGGDRLNRTAQLKTGMYLRGVEQMMLDLALNSKMVEAINERLVDFFLEYNRRIFEQAAGQIDIFFMGDDFGTQNGLMMSLEMWRHFFKPGFRKFIDLAHRYGIKVMHHSCGAVEPLIPDFIECGLDILQSLQPRAAGMDFAAIKQKYGREICFQGGIDIQNTLPFGTAAEVRAEAAKVIRTLAPGGGYLFCTAHNMQADTPVENVLALYEAARLYGSYR